MDPYVGEIRLFAGSYAPQGWLLCDGTSYPISNYDTLYAVIGTTYGGNGVSVFNVPDLRDKLPIGQGQGTGLSPRTIGQSVGTSAVTLNQSNMPAHTHPVNGTQNLATATVPAPTLMLGTLARPPATSVFYGQPAGASEKAFAPQALAAAGSSLPHSNMMPSLSVNYIIAWTGIYPSQG